MRMPTHKCSLLRRAFGASVLCVLVRALVLPSSAQMVSVDFTGTVRTLYGNIPVPLTAGDSVAGHIQVDLAHLPAGGFPSPDFGFYSYMQRNPGFTFDVAVGGQIIHYDSTTASMEGGPGMGIVLMHGPTFDQLTFDLRPQGNPFTLQFAMLDTQSPLALLIGNRFPQDVQPAGMTGAELSYMDVSGNNGFEARIDSVAFVVPEPSIMCLCGLFGLVLLWSRRVGYLRRKTISREPEDRGSQQV